MIDRGVDPHYAVCSSGSVRAHRNVFAVYADDSLCRADSLAFGISDRVYRIAYAVRVGERDGFYVGIDALQCGSNAISELADPPIYSQGREV